MQSLLAARRRAEDVVRRTQDVQLYLNIGYVKAAASAGMFAVVMLEKRRKGREVAKRKITRDLLGSGIHLLCLLSCLLLQRRQEIHCGSFRRVRKLRGGECGCCLHAANFACPLESCLRLRAASPLRIDVTCWYVLERVEYRCVAVQLVICVR